MSIEEPSVEFWDQLAALAEDGDRETALHAMRLSIAFNKRRRLSIDEPEPRRRRIQTSDEGGPLSQASMFCPAPLRRSASDEAPSPGPVSTGVSQPTPRPVMSDSPRPLQPSAVYLLDTLRCPESPGCPLHPHSGPPNVWQLRRLGTIGQDLWLEVAKDTHVSQSAPRLRVLLSFPWSQNEPHSADTLFSHRLALAAKFSLPVGATYHLITLGPLPLDKATPGTVTYAIGLQTNFSETDTEPVLSPIDWNFRAITLEQRTATRTSVGTKTRGPSRRRTKTSSEEETTHVDPHLEMGQSVPAFSGGGVGTCPWFICSVKLLDLKLHLRVELRDEVDSNEGLTTEIQVVVGYPFAGVETQVTGNMSDRAVVYYSFVYPDTGGSETLRRRILVVPGVPVAPTLVGAGYQRSQATYPIGVRVRRRDNTYTDTKWFLRCTSINSQTFTRLGKNDLIAALRWLPRQAHLYNVNPELKQEISTLTVESLKEKDTPALVSLLERFVRCFTKVK